ncbi:MAG: helix-hairpin-helix domain-containing protein [Granulosicoccus sp.]|nr:helix-hairpin-helix domain-containing protein [Granulosicoccus sp.]
MTCIGYEPDKDVAMIAQRFSSTSLMSACMQWRCVLLSLISVVQMVHADAGPSLSVDGTRLHYDTHTASGGRRNHALPGALPRNSPGTSAETASGSPPAITGVGVGESPVAGTENPGTDTGQDDVSVTLQGSVDINSATEMELAEALPGIGPSKARAIVAWRQLNGPFQSIEQLLEVSGIGPVTLENIRPYIRIGDSLSSSLLELRRKSDEAAVIRSLSRVMDGVLGKRGTLPKAVERQDR